MYSLRDQAAKMCMPLRPARRDIGRVSLPYVGVAAEAERAHKSEAWRFQNLAGQIINYH